MGYLLNSRAELASRYGVHCVGRREILDSDYFSVVQMLKQGKTVSEALEVRAIKSFQNIVEGTDCDTVIFSAEDFFSPLFFKNARRVSSWLSRLSEGYQKEMILYTRKQSDYLESWYMQLIHVGKLVDYQDYLNDLDLDAISWLDVLDEISNGFDGGRLVIRPFEMIKALGSRAFLNDFLEGLNSSIKQKDLPSYDLHSVNRSFSYVAFLMAKAARPHLDDAEWVKLRKFLQNKFSTKTHERMKFPLSAGISERHAKGNEAMFSKYMPEYDAESLGYLK